jgi:hypothetical protein
MTANRRSPPSVQASVRFVCEEEIDTRVQFNSPTRLPPSLSAFSGRLFCAAGLANASCEVTLYNLDVFQGLALRVRVSTADGDGTATGA